MIDFMVLSSKIKMLNNSYASLSNRLENIKSPDVLYGDKNTWIIC